MNSTTCYMLEKERRPVKDGARGVGQQSTDGDEAARSRSMSEDRFFQGEKGERWSEVEKKFTKAKEAISDYSFLKKFGEKNAFDFFNLFQIYTTRITR